jgi:hypothetical protein
MLLMTLALLAASGFGDVAFMAGYWRGEMGPAVIEEVWLPAEGDAMHSVFRMVRDGKTAFTEFQSIERQGGTLVLHLRHFHPGLKAWEDTDGALRWHIERTGPNLAVFRQQNAETRLEYHREGDRLTVTLVKEGKRQPFPFRLVKEF